MARVFMETLPILDCSTSLEYSTLVYRIASCWFILR